MFVEVSQSSDTCLDEESGLQRSILQNVDWVHVVSGSGGQVHGDLGVAEETGPRVVGMKAVGVNVAVGTGVGLSEVGEKVS